MRKNSQNLNERVMKKIHGDDLRKLRKNRKTTRIAHQSLTNLFNNKFTNLYSQSLLVLPIYHKTI